LASFTSILLFFESFKSIFFPLASLASTLASFPPFLSLSSGCFLLFLGDYYFLSLGLSLAFLFLSSLLSFLLSLDLSTTFYIDLLSFLLSLLSLLSFLSSLPPF